jgi:hypothetical protein
MLKEHLPSASPAHQVRTTHRGCQTKPPLPTAVPHPCDETSLSGAREAYGEGDHSYSCGSRRQDQEHGESEQAGDDFQLCRRFLGEFAGMAKPSSAAGMGLDLGDGRSSRCLDGTMGWTVGIVSTIKA